jgi:putative membrane protein
MSGNRAVGGTAGAPISEAEALGPDVQHWLAYERTHLANERTFAAWLRTGLSVSAVGIAVAHLLPEARRPVLSLTLGSGFVLAGLVLIVFGAWRYGRTHRELAAAGGHRRPVAPRLTYAVTAFIAALLLALLLVV